MVSNSSNDNNHHVTDRVQQSPLRYSVAGINNEQTRIS